MSWFSWLSRKSGQSASQNRQRAVDLRSPQAREAATAAISNIGSDEQLATQLVNLVGQIKAPDWRTSTLQQDAAYGKVREIGERININGGLERMQRVGYRVKALGGNARLLEISWHRIGDWME